MPIAPGVHRLGPGDATLLVKTGRTGAAAKAGHDLVLEVTAWHATLEVADATSLTLEADAGSLRVRSGSGGIQALGDDDKANIETTIDDDVLRRTDIAFHSTDVRGGDGSLDVHGELELAGRVHPIAFALAIGEDGALTGTAVVRQTDWGIKPYTALFGTLKVADEVQVVIEGRLPTA